MSGATPSLAHVDAISSPRLGRVLRLAALIACLVAAGVGPAVGSAAASTPMVDLGRASTYAVLSGASVGNTVSAPGAAHTTLRGSLGVVANSQPLGFPPGIVTGATDVGNAAAANANTDVVAAYAEIVARTGGLALASALAGATIAPGLHTVAGAVSNTGTVTLDGGGDPNAVFVFQVNGAMAMAAGSHVVLTGGAQASRVFWQVNGAGAIGANATFAGTLLALNAVAVGNGSVVNGRAFALTGALTLDADEFYSAPPVVTITGGAAATSTDTTPTISGTTDVEAPAVVTVMINGQTLTAVPVAGAWSVTSTILANATYTVVGSVIDAAGNVGSFTQQLTVDTVPPIVTLDGGPSVTTNDPRPTIGGTSDVAPGTVVHVIVGTQTLTALVQITGMWNIRPAALSDGTRTVAVSVADPAGNPGIASQTLIVDTTAPTLTIAGGSSALIDDATPQISGSTDVLPGTTVVVTTADQTLAGIVLVDGTWAVIAGALADGPHVVTAQVSDAAGNVTRSTQTLTVDTASPTVTIDGGTTATTSNLDPTITGTSNAAPGTIVTVSVGGQIVTTLLQASGTWNVTPAPLALGTWLIVASVPDPAGNVGGASQLLTVEPAAASTVGGPTAPSGPAASSPSPVSGPESAPAPPAHALFDAATATTIDPGGHQRISGRALSIRMKVSAPAGGRVDVSARGTVVIGGARTTIKLAAVRVALAAGASTTMRFATGSGGKAARAALSRIRAARAAHELVVAMMTFQMVDAAGNSHAVARTVTLV